MENSGYPDYIDSRFSVMASESCNSCRYNFENSRIVINFNPICAHCERCTFIKTDLYVEENKNA